MEGNSGDTVEGCLKHCRDSGWGWTREGDLRAPGRKAQLRRALESQTALPGALALTLPHTWLSLLLASPRALTLALTYWQRSSEAVIYGGDEILCMSNI